MSNRHVYKLVRETKSKFNTKLTASLAAALLLTSSIVPGLAPFVGMANAAAGDVWITAAMPQPSAGEPEYVTLHNNTSLPLDIGHWTINDGTNHEITEAATALGAGDEATICPASVADAHPTVCTPGFSVSGLGLNDDGDTITLTNPSSVLTDSVSYASSTEGVEVTFSTHLGPDTTAPTVTAVGPADGSTIGSTIDLEVTASDNLGASNVSDVKYYVYGHTVGSSLTYGYLDISGTLSSSSAGSWTGQITGPLPTNDGSRSVSKYAILYIATDRSGNVSFAHDNSILVGVDTPDTMVSDNLTVDTGGPAINILSPQTGDVILEQDGSVLFTQYDITFEATDGSGIDTSSINLAWYHDGDPSEKQAPVSCDFEQAGDVYKFLNCSDILWSSFSPAYELEDGDRLTLEVTVADNNGNSTTVTESGIHVREVAADTTDPVTDHLEPNKPGNNSTWNGPIEIAATSEDNQGVDYVNIYAKPAGAVDSAYEIVKTVDNPANDSPFVWSTTWTPDQNGTYDIKAAAVDTSGNEENSAYATNVTYIEGPFDNIDTGESFNSLQAAIDDSDTVDGHTIEVDGGSHATGNIVMDKDLAIAGEAGSKPTLTRTSDTAFGGSWFVIEGGVTASLSNLEINGSGHKVFAAIKSSGTTAIDNVDFRNIRHGDYYGFAIAGLGGHVNGGFGGDYAPSALTVSNSTFENIGRVGVYVKGDQSTATVTGITYTGKGAVDGLDYGVEFSGGATGSVTDSTITNNRGVASSDGSTSGAIYASTFHGAGTSVTIVNNELTNNSTAIPVGYDASDTATVVAHHNNITGNDQGIFATAASKSVTATENWWGDVTGPSGQGSGSGDSVDANVDDYAPWLCQPFQSGSKTSSGGSCDTAAPPAPTANPTGSTFNRAVLVRLTNSESGVTIHYTTDGSAPSCSSTTYSSPIAVNNDTTIKAVACDSAGNVSLVMSQTYVIETSSDNGDDENNSGANRNEGTDTNDGGFDAGTTGIASLFATTTPQVLGISTDTQSNTDSENEQKNDKADNQVKGAEDTKKVEKAADENSNDAFLGLGWWWLPILLVLGFVAWLLAKRRAANDA